ncbi:MAG: cell division protein FtsL [Lachnospiraceae bacterium]|nr:cell division protein FtsL [Lachnospiraceae bacterium]
MNDTRQGRQFNNRTPYMYGNAARNIDVRKAIEEAPTGEPLRTLRGERKKAHKMHMGFVYVLFLAVAVVVMGYALISYLKLQSEITSLSDSISVHQTALNNLTLANDDEYSKMVNAVDFDEIKRIAIEELGMVYASEDQIIAYTRENSDYVRQINDLSD